ncbi:MAG: type 2 isopentenyl-diphosphate Delta-isomerase [Polyangiaceae bacterium]
MVAIVQLALASEAEKIMSENKPAGQSPATSGIGSRKVDHIALCATGDVGFHGTTTLLEGVRLMHDALPDLRYDELDAGIALFGKRLKLPLCIASMTGGTEEATRINRDLAAVAEARGLAFGVGSQRAMFVRPETATSYRIRDVAPTAVVLGNLGVVQAREMKTTEIAKLVDAIGADALCIHLNPAMELVQPGGDRDFSGGLLAITRIVKELAVPVIVKETGCGISEKVAKRLKNVGVQHVDVSGAGGTSWVGVETKRAEALNDAPSKQLGESFWNWGIPTAASVAMCASVGFETIFATGGIKSGMDIARAISLGANLGGIARPMLQAVREHGEKGAHAFVDVIEAELRAAMLLTGSKNVNALRNAEKIVVGELALWLSRERA